jgi:hypothetical protein
MFVARLVAGEVGVFLFLELQARLVIVGLWALPLPAQQDPRQPAHYLSASRPLPSSEADFFMRQ